MNFSLSQWVAIILSVTFYFIGYLSLSCTFQWYTVAILSFLFLVAGKFGISSQNSHFWNDFLGKQI